MKRIPVLILALGFLATAATAQDKADKLDGKWTVVSVERNGKTEDIFKAATRVMTGDKYTLTLKDGKAMAGTFKSDATKKPKTMDIMPGDGTYKGKTLLGIYELDGDTLKVCFAEPGKDRPTEVAAKPGCVLVVHKREK